MNIIPEDTLKEKRLKKLMGDDYHNKPALRLILSRLEGVQRVEDLDGGRPCEWGYLDTEREQKIATVFFWRGVEFADEWLSLIHICTVTITCSVLRF